MKLVPVKCPSCGAVVEVDEYSRSFQCKHCGVSTVIEKDSYNYNYNDDRLEKTEIMIKEHKDYKGAKLRFQTMIDTDPKDPRPWLGLIRCLTCDFTEKLYIAPENYPPIWLGHMEENINYIFSKYEQLENKQEALESIRTYLNDYIQNNKNEYEDLKAKFPEEEKQEVATYDTTIKAANRIIANTDIRKIFEEMYKTLQKYQAISAVEKKRNEKYDSDDQEASFIDESSKMTFEVNFTDSTESRLDNYDEFMNVFDTRLKEIKSIYVSYSLNYSVRKPKTPTKEKIYNYENQSIHLLIYPDKFEIETKLKSDDRKLDNIYNLIRNIVTSSPVKYDKLIKKRSLYQILIGISFCLIPSTILCLVLLANESLRESIFEYAYLFPLMCLGIAFAMSSLVFIKLSSMYKSIIPDQRYAGLSKDMKSTYVDDVDDFTKKSEVIIGKNYKNLEIRKSLNDMISLCKKLILPELGGVGIVSIIIYYISMNS